MKAYCLLFFTEEQARDAARLIQRIWRTRCKHVPCEVVWDDGKRKPRRGVATRAREIAKAERERRAFAQAYLAAHFKPAPRRGRRK